MPRVVVSYPLRKSGTMKKNVFVIFVCVVIAAVIAGCKYRDVYPTMSDTEMRGKLTERQLKAIYQSQTGGVGEWEDVVKGSGRQAFPGRKIVVDVEAKNSAGEPYGAGRMTILYPPAPQISSGRIDETLFLALYGMKAGGTRRIALSSAVCQGRTDKPCELSGANPGEASLTYLKGAPAVFTVKLVSVCRPYIVEKTTFTIPIAVAARKTEEWWCR
jgi:hypothetical protein